MGIEIWASEVTVRIRRAERLRDGMHPLCWGDGDGKVPEEMLDKM